MVHGLLHTGQTETLDNLAGPFEILGQFGLLFKGEAPSTKST